MNSEALQKDWFRGTGRQRTNNKIRKRTIRYSLPSSANKLAHRSTQNPIDKLVSKGHRDVIGILDQIIAVHVYVGQFAVKAPECRKIGYCHWTALYTFCFASYLALNLRAVTNQKDRMTMAINVTFVLTDHNGTIASLLNPALFVSLKDSECSLKHVYAPTVTEVIPFGVIT